MANLIDRDKLMQEVYYRYNLAYGGESYNPYDFYQLVKDFPTVEAERLTNELTLRDVLSFIPNTTIHLCKKEGNVANDYREIGIIFSYSSNSCLFNDKILDAKVKFIGPFNECGVRVGIEL